MISEGNLTENTNLAEAVRKGRKQEDNPPDQLWTIRDAPTCYTKEHTHFRADG